MTTIAYRGGVMAADRRAYAGESTPIGMKTKIAEIHGYLIGVSSTQVGLGNLIFDHFEEHVSLPHIEDRHLSMLLVDPEGQVFFANGSCHLTGPLEAPYYAIGSGSHYALGAMAMGATADRAVQVAAQFDVWTSGEVNVLVHKSLRVAA